MYDLFLQSFKVNFDNIYRKLENAVAICPEELWAKKAGGFIFWQQLYHAFAIIDFFILAPGGQAHQALFDADVYRLLREERHAPDKAKILEVATVMKAAVHAYCDAMTPEKLAARNENRSQRFGREISNGEALMLLIGHGMYHIGACDAVFREHGIQGLM